MTGERRPAYPVRRRQARSLAMQVLFESGFRAAAGEEGAGDSGAGEGASIEEILARRLAEDDVPADVGLYAETLLRGVWGRREQFDKLIAAAAPTWPINQMPRVDHNILWLALFELLHNEEVPIRTAINEAVELAKEFGSESSSRFINGVLGTVAAQNGEEAPEPLRPATSSSIINGSDDTHHEN